MRDSHGRHGGNSGKTDKGEAANERAQAGSNTDVDSLANGRNEDRGGKSGGSGAMAGAGADADLRRNPGIGQSAGTFATGEDPASIEGENTVEGDVDNDTTAGDGVNAGPIGPHQRMR